MFQLLLAVIYLAFISLGLPDSLLGSAWPTMYREFSVPVSYAGGISMIIAVGTIISSLLSDRLTKRFGAGKITAVSVFMTAAALFGFSTSHTFIALCLWAVPYGLGAGCVDAALNNYVALHLNSSTGGGGGGGGGGGWPLYYGIRIIKRTQLEYGIPLYFHSSDPADGRTAVQPTPLEKANCSYQKQSYCCVISRTGAFSLSDCSDFRCKRNYDHVFLLLCSGTDNRTLGQQLSGFTLGADF